MFLVCLLLRCTGTPFPPCPFLPRDTQKENHVNAEVTLNALLASFFVVMIIGVVAALAAVFQFLELTVPTAVELGVVLALLVLLVLWVLKAEVGANARAAKLEVNVRADTRGQHNGLDTTPVIPSMIRQR